jgi:hypothetical protein
MSFTAAAWWASELPLNRRQAASDKGRFEGRERADCQLERLLHQVDHRVPGAQIDRGFRVANQEIGDDRTEERPCIRLNRPAAGHARLLVAPRSFVRFLQVVKDPTQQS